MRVLLVEDDEILGRALIRSLTDWGTQARWVTTLAQAQDEVSYGLCADLVILDVGLPDGSGVALAQTLSTRRPMPLMIAISGQANATEAFQLAQLGVTSYLPKPLSFADFVATVEQVMQRAPDLAPLLVASVGRKPFQDVQEQVRRAMTEQALALCQGNRTGAARLLGVTRQAVQQLIHNLDISVEEQSSPIRNV